MRVEMPLTGQNLPVGAETIPGQALLLGDEEACHVVEAKVALGHAGSRTWQVAVGVGGNYCYYFVMGICCFCLPSIYSVF